MSVNYLICMSRFKSQLPIQFTCSFIFLDMAPREGRKKKQVTHEVVTREYTVNIHKRIHGM